MTRRRFITEPTPSEADDALRKALARRTDLGYDEQGRSAEPGPNSSAADGKPVSRPPQGARDTLPSPDLPDDWLRAQVHEARGFGAWQIDSTG